MRNNLEPGHGRSGTAEPSSEPANLSSTVRVLLVEDSASDAYLVDEYLGAGAVRTYDVTHFDTLRAALRSAGPGGGDDFDVALLDLFLPDSQGLETLRTFKTAFPDLAAVVLTGSSDEALALEALEYGAQDYVVKTGLRAEMLQRSLVHAVARKRLERDLRVSELRYRELFEHSLDGVARTAPDGTIYEMNRAFLDMLGYTKAEVEARPLHRRDVVDLSDPRLSEALEVRGRTGGFRGELRFVRKDGTVLPVELTTNVYRDEEGQERTSMIVRDVSEKRESERVMKDYREQLTRSESMSLVMITHTDVDGRWTMVPQRFCELLGYTEDELLGMRYQDITHPNDLEDSVAIDRQIVAGERTSLEVEKRYVRKDGSTVWVYLNSTIVTDRDGHPLHLRKYVRDITAERAAEEQALHNYQVLLSRIATLAEEVSLAQDSAGVYRALFEFAHASTPAEAIEVARLETNRGMLRCVYRASKHGDAVHEHDPTVLSLLPLNDLPPARAVRERRTVISDEDDSPATHPWFDDLELEGALRPAGVTVAVPMLVENEIVGVFEVRSSSEQRFAHEHLTALQMTANLAAVATQNVELFARETEARKQAEAGRSRLQSVLEQAPALIATSEGPDHVFTTANQEYREFFGGRDIVGRKVTDLLPELEGQGIIAILDRVFRTGESFANKELPMDLDRYGTGDVERHYFNLVYQALRDAAGHTIGILANAVNITEQVQARKRAESAQVEMEAAYEQTIEGWARALDLRDEETAGHSQRVTQMAVALARRFGIEGDELEDLRRGALLHDIGKMGVPDTILLKPGALTPEEWEIMKGHTVYGRDLLRPIAFLASAIDIPYSHHEKWDGSGYPQGLQGEHIPLAARIFAVVDVYDALMSDRPYRPAWPPERVVAHLREESGKHFDPNVVDGFLDLVEQG